MRRLGAFVGIVVAMLAVAGAAPVTAGLGGTEARLFAVSDGDGAVYEIPIGGGPATNIGTSGFDTGTGLAYDPSTGTLFAIDYNTGAFDVTFATPPPNGTLVRANYTRLAQAIQFQMTGGTDGSVITSPSRKMSPSSISISRSTQRSSVDLPEPDGPMIATYSLRRTARSTPRRAWTTSPPMS